MMSHCRGSEIDVKHRIYVPHSLGSLYTMVCEFIGYSKYGDEGKVMGLAPLGKDAYARHFDEMVLLNDQGMELNPRFFQPFGSNQGMSILPTTPTTWSSCSDSPACRTPRSCSATWTWPSGSSASSSARTCTC
jgi:predicted NodU family carbamoyl transferase